MKFVVTAENSFMETCLETNDVNEACEAFNILCESREPAFYDVNIYDGETGEVYAYQRIEHSPSGVTITKWIAN